MSIKNVIYIHPCPEAPYFSQRPVHVLTVRQFFV